MRHNQLRSFVVASWLLLSLLLPLAGSQAAPIMPGDAAPLRLAAATFVPVRGEAPALPPELTIAAYPAGQPGYYIVQFRGPIQETWKQQVEATGAELLDYIPEFAFKARMTSAQAGHVRDLAEVAWVGIFQPAYKLDLTLRGADSGVYRVRIERGVDLPAAVAAIAGTGADTFQQAERTLLVAADQAQLDALARLPDVAWIERYVLPQKHNEYGGGVILGSHAANTSGYDGSTQIAAVADTGLGGGTTATAHRDIPASRIVAIYNWPGAGNSCLTVVPDGAQDVDSGHGTHTSASVLSGGGPAGEGQGVAPAARLVFQATEDFARVKSTPLCRLLYPDGNGYFLLGLPGDLHTLYQQAYDAGARIHSNSWGSAVSGKYTSESAQTDDFIWNHRDMAITFSAGNNGIDANSDGLVDSGSVGSPGTSKNVITVGASENQRGDAYPCDSALTYINPSTGQSCYSQAGVNNLGAYGSSWPADFPANPLKDDPTAGNQEQMAAFSSRGPTQDGRIKPDVVAPGTFVLSAYSDLYQEGYDGTGGTGANPQNSAYQYDGWGFPLDRYYKYMGGTSMANPLVAGAATVLRDYYQKAYGHSASVALVKATLINSAVDLLDENNDGVNDNAFPIPNVHEGWGRANLANATDASHAFIDYTTGISTSTSITYELTSAGAQSFKVTLVWSDYPAVESAAKTLVNDLDLVVTAPDGTTTYLGNVFSGGWSQTGGAADRTNNVENVYVAAPAAGIWRVEVRGYNVPNGPQPFALVVDNATWPAPVLAIAPLDSTTVRLSWAPRSQDDAYQAWRNASPYFAPGDPGAIMLPDCGASTCDDAGILGQPNVRYFYTVRGIVLPGQASPGATQVGVFAFELMPGGE